MKSFIFAALLLFVAAVNSSASDVPIPSCFPCGGGGGWNIAWLEFLVLWI